MTRVRFEQGEEIPVRYVQEANRSIRTDASDEPTTQERYDAIERNFAQRRDAQYKTIADHALKIGDQASAGFWNNQRVNCDYAMLPPGMSRGRLIEIAGLVGVSTDASASVTATAPTLRGVLVQHLLRLIACAERPELRLDAIDDGANPLERRFARDDAREAAERAARNDEWNNQAVRHVPKSVAMLGATQNPANPIRSSRTGQASASSTPAWGEEYKRAPRSAQFVADSMKEPARNGGMATADVVEPEER